MSKIKDVLFGHMKDKARHSLRRMETKKIKRERIRNCRQGIYPFCVGYYIVNGRYEYVYEEKVIPEHTEMQKAYVGCHPVLIKNWNEETMEWEYEIDKWHPVFHKIPVTVPEKRIRKKVSRIYREFPERPKRISTGIKEYRKDASRKLRRISAENDILYNRGLYKKLGEVKWLIW